jgi:hypothetical protein
MKVVGLRFVSSSSLADGGPIRVAARRPGSRLAGVGGNVGVDAQSRTSFDVAGQQVYGSGPVADTLRMSGAPVQSDRVRPSDHGLAEHSRLGQGVLSSAGTRPH